MDALYNVVENVKSNWRDYLEKSREINALIFRIAENREFDRVRRFLLAALDEYDATSIVPGDETAEIETDETKRFEFELEPGLSVIFSDENNSDLAIDSNDE